MPGSSIRNRSDPVTVQTLRGTVEVVRQQWRSQRANSRWEWLARRSGTHDWRQGSTVREAIRHATLLPTVKQPKWLVEAASRATEELGS
jgi:hypothetical protein